MHACRQLGIRALRDVGRTFGACSAREGLALCVRAPGAQTAKPPHLFWFGWKSPGRFRRFAGAIFICLYGAGHAMSKMAGPVSDGGRGVSSGVRPEGRLCLARPVVELPGSKKSESSRPGRATCSFNKIPGPSFGPLTGSLDARRNSLPPVTGCGCGQDGEAVGVFPRLSSVKIGRPIGVALFGELPAGLQFGRPGAGAPAKAGWGRFGGFLLPASGP